MKGKIAMSLVIGMAILCIWGLINLLFSDQKKQIFYLFLVITPLIIGFWAALKVNTRKP